MLWDRVGRQEGCSRCRVCNASRTSTPCQGQTCRTCCTQFPGTTRCPGHGHVLRVESPTKLWALSQAEKTWGIVSSGVGCRVLKCAECRTNGVRQCEGDGNGNGMVSHSVPGTSRRTRHRNVLRLEARNEGCVTSFGKRGEPLVRISPSCMWHSRTRPGLRKWRACT